MNNGLLSLSNKYMTTTLGLLGRPTPIGYINVKPSFTPLSINDLVAWFDAADDDTFILTGSPQNSVSTWQDKSDNKYLLTQTVSNNQPTRELLPTGQWTINFDGVNDTLLNENTGLSSIMSGKRPITVFTVGRMHDPSETTINNTGTWLAWGSSTSGTPFIYYRSNGSSGAFQLALRSDGSNSNGGYLDAGPIGQSNSTNTAPDRFITSFCLPSNGQTFLRMHTPSFATGAGAARPLYGARYSSASRPDDTYTVNRFAVGSLWRNSSPSDYFPGRISEIIIYSRFLTNQEIADISLWLGTKHNLSIPLPS